MNPMKLVLRWSLLLLLVGGFSFASFAEEEEKKKNNGNTSEKASQPSDSSLLDIDLDAADVDDTLVFEDWDKPGDEGSLGYSNKFVFNPAFSQKKNVNDGHNNQNIVKCMEFNYANRRAVNFAIYPNPAVEQIHINTDNIAQEIRVMDINGKEYMRIPFRAKVEVAHLPPGYYVIQLIYPDHVESRKFVKN